MERAHVEMIEVRTGWGTWIRTKIDGVRVPIETLISFTYFANWIKNRAINFNWLWAFSKPPKNAAMVNTARFSSGPCLRCRGRGPAPSTGTGVRLSVETFTLVRKSHLCGIPGSHDRDDIDAIKVIFVPLRHEGRIAAVCGEERTGYGFDKPVLPGDDDNRVAIERLFESRSQPIRIGDTEARIDRQPEKNRSGLDRREGSDVIVGDSVIFPLLGGVGSEDGARPAEGFGFDWRQGQSAIETLAVELTEPLVRLLPVPNEHDRLNGIVAQCTSPVE